MNVDVLSNNPSIRWYFIVAIPFTVLVLVVAALMQNAPAIWNRFRARSNMKDDEVA